MLETRDIVSAYSTSDVVVPLSHWTLSRMIVRKVWRGPMLVRTNPSQVFYCVENWNYFLGFRFNLSENNWQRTALFAVLRLQLPVATPSCPVRVTVTGSTGCRCEHPRVTRRRDGTHSFCLQAPMGKWFFPQECLNYGSRGWKHLFTGFLNLGRV